MHRIPPDRCVMMLLATICSTAYAPAQADVTVTLLDVTFADGGKASGYFNLNVYGYLDAVDITTTAGTVPGSIPSSNYSLAGSNVPNGPMFDSIFYFQNTSGDFALNLTAATVLPLTGGYDALTPGSGDGNSLAGSYETCIENCASLTYLDTRLISSGALEVGEPATLAITILSSLGLLVIGRRWRKTDRLSQPGENQTRRRVRQRRVPNYILP